MVGKVIAYAGIVWFFTLVMRARAVQQRTGRRVSLYEAMSPGALYLLAAWFAGGAVIQIAADGSDRLLWNIAGIAGGALLARTARRRQLALAETTPPSP